MIIPGIEPPIINKTQNEKSKPVVREVDKIVVKKRGNREEDQQQISTNLKREDIEDALEKLNKTVEGLNIKLKFQLQEKEGKYYVDVYNREKESLIKEVPPERVIDTLEQMNQVVGLLVDELI